MTVTSLPEIGVTVISRWIFNCYVVHDGGDGRPFVVDLGLPSQVPIVESVLASLGSSAREVAFVFATHGHSDHVGGVADFVAEAATPVVFHERVRTFVDGGDAPRMPSPGAVAKILPVFADQPREWAALPELAKASKRAGIGPRTANALPFADLRWVADGEQVPGAPAWTVLHTPGHTDDSCSLYHDASATLISGDAVLSAAGRAWFNPELCDDELATATEDRLRSLAVGHLLPGHGRPVDGAVMAHAVSHDGRPPDSGALRTIRQIFSRH